MRKAIPSSAIRPASRTRTNSSTIQAYLDGGYLKNGGGGWQLDGNGIAGYIASTQLTGTVPLYHRYHPPVLGPEESVGEVGGAIQIFNRTHFRRCRPSSYDAF